MAGPGRRTTASVADELLEAPGAFSFWQVVRLLRLLGREADGAMGATGRDSDSPPAGGVDPAPAPAPSPSSLPPFIRLEINPSLGFPDSDVHRVRLDQDENYHVTVNCFGMIGPSGVLPLHYTEMLVDQAAQKSAAAKEFVDLLNHRWIELYYLAGVRSRVEIGYEEGNDPFTRALSCLVGLGTPSTGNRLSVEDEALLFYAGVLSRRPVSAAGLRGILEDYFGLPATIHTFTGGWIPLDQGAQSRLSSTLSEDSNNVLERPAPDQPGNGAVLGKRVWMPQSRFRIRIGPADFARHLEFTPGNVGYRRMQDLVRFAVGLETEADLQVVVRAGQIPRLQIGGAERESSARLGWSTWLLSEPTAMDDDQVVVALTG